MIEEPPGAGKTSLVTRWAHDLADRFFPGWQIYLNLQGFTPGRSAVDRERAVLALLPARRVAPDAAQTCRAARFVRRGSPANPLVRAESLE